MELLFVYRSILSFEITSVPVGGSNVNSDSGGPTFSFSDEKMKVETAS